MSLRLPLARASTYAALLCTVVALAAASVSPASAAVSSPTGSTWGTDGRVSVILTDPANGVVYVGGNFANVIEGDGTTTHPASNFAVYQPSSGTFDTSWTLAPNGPVNALALSGGKLYLGGDFTQVNTAKRTRLAAVDTGTRTLADWTPRVTGGKVKALAVRDGGAWVHVGGNFTTLAGVAQPYLGRVSASTGALAANWTPRPDAPVRSLIVAPAPTPRVYVGGGFTAINGNNTAKSIASLGLKRPTLTAGFNAGSTNAGNEPEAIDLYLDGSNLLAAVGGSGGGCTSLDAQSGKTQWSKHANGNMQAVTAMAGTVYCGGHFGGLGSFAGEDRYKLAAVNESTGVVEPSFAPRLNSALGVWSLAHDTSSLYVGGDFTKIRPGRVLRPHFAVFN